MNIILLFIIILSCPGGPYACVNGPMIVNGHGECVCLNWV